MYSLNGKNEMEKLNEAVLSVGQIFFLNGYGQDVHSHERLAVYEIYKSDFDGRTNYKWVNLDKPKRGIVNAYTIRHVSKLHGIGHYYQDNQFCTPDEITDALAEAINAEKNEAVIKEAGKIAAEEKQKYLSQFKKADRRTTTNILKRHILKTWQQVSKVEIRTDVYSGGDSMDVTYYAPEQIESLETFIRSFQEGRFNGMIDLYEYDSNKEEIILEGHILQTYKFSFARFEQSDVIREVKQTKEKSQAVEASIQNSSFSVVEYSERAIAVFGDTRAIKDQLKDLGGRFNRYLTHNGSKQPGWIFSKSKAEQLKALLG